MASSGGHAGFHLEANGVNVTGSVTLNRSVGADARTELRVHGLRLTAGRQYLKLVVEAGSPELDWFEITPAAE